MLEGDVQMRGQQPVGHQREHRIDVRIGIDIMEAHPRGAAFAGLELPEFARQIGHMCAHLAAVPLARVVTDVDARSEEHTSELQSLMRISYAVFCLKTQKTIR